MTFKRVTIDPNKMGGLPCIKGLCIPLVTIVDLLVNHLSREDILLHYPDLEPEDIDEALKYAADTLRERYFD